MSTRWQREAEKGNEAAVQYKEDLGKQPPRITITNPSLTFSVDFETLERKTLNRMIQSPGFFDQMERAQRMQRKAETVEASTYQSMSRDAFMGGLSLIAGIPLRIESKTPRTWGEWVGKLEEHDRDAITYQMAEDPRVRPEHRPLERELGRYPGWGRVVSLDNVAERYGIPSAKVIETQGYEAAAPERAPEAKALFAALLAEPSTQDLVVCACGRIEGRCYPVQAKLDKRAKFLRVKGGTGAYLSSDDQKALQTDRESRGKYAPRSAIYDLEPDELEVTDHYE